MYSGDGYCEISVLNVRERFIWEKKSSHLTFGRYVGISFHNNIFLNNRRIYLRVVSVFPWPLCFPFLSLR